VCDDEKQATRGFDGMVEKTVELVCKLPVPTPTQEEARRALHQMDKFALTIQADDQALFYYLYRQLLQVRLNLVALPKEDCEKIKKVLNEKSFASAKDETFSSQKCSVIAICILSIVQNMISHEHYGKCIEPCVGQIMNYFEKCSSLS